jgi:xylulokinase
VVFAVADAVDLLGVPAGGAADDAPVLLSGGGGRAEVVRQVVADVLARPVRPLRLRNASATGAALLAARGAGVDLAVDRGTGALVEPRVVPALGEALERWRPG